MLKSRWLIVQFLIDRKRQEIKDLEAEARQLEQRLARGEEIEQQFWPTPREQEKRNG